MKRISLFICSYLLVFTLYAQPNRYGLPIIHNYHHAETGGGEQNWGITQDQRGVIYVANNDNGILEYDGSSWRTLPLPGDVAARSLAVGEDGFIYAGLEGDFGRLEPDQSGSLNYTSLMDSVYSVGYPDFIAWKTYYQADKVFFCGMEAIFVFDPSSDALTVIETPEHALFSYFLDNQLYITNYGLGLMKYEGDEFVPIKGGDFFREKNVSGLLFMDTGLLLVSTFHKGLFLMNMESGAVDSTFLQAEVKEELSSAMVISLEKDKRNIYVGTMEEGVFVLDKQGQVKEKISQNEGLLDNTIVSIHVDQGFNEEPVLWLAHWNGISSVHINSPFRMNSVGRLTREMDGRSSGDLITDVLEFGGNLYVSTMGGLYQRQEYSTGIRFRPARRIREEIHDLLVMQPASGKEFLLASGEEKTYVIDGSNNLSTLPVGGNKLIPDRKNPGIFYTGKNKFHAFRYQDGRWIEFLDIDIDSWIQGMIQDRFDFIWLSTWAGLLRLDLHNSQPVKPERFDTEHGLPADEMTSVFEDPESQEILVSTDEGLLHFDYYGERFEKDSLYNSLLPPGKNSIRNIYRGSDSICWVSFENENSGWNTVAARRTESGLQNLYDRPFSSLPPMASTNVFYSDSEGKFWFTRANELYHFDPSKLSENQGNFRVLMRQVRIYGDSVLFGGTHYTKDPGGLLIPRTEQTGDTRASLKYTYRDLEFRWSAPSCTNERQISYSYYLDGFMEDWSDWIRSRSSKFTNLPHGKYVMHVKARNAYGDESEESTYAFNILRPWYATLVALSLYFVLLCSLVVFVVLYTRNLRSRAELLEKQNREIELQKTELENLNVEITAQRDEIEAQRDSISEQKELIDRQNLAMTDSIHYARRIQDAVLPAREVMNYLLPKHFVFYQPRDIVSGDFYWVDIRDDIVLIAVADCTGHGVPGAFMSMLGISLLNEISSKFSDQPTNEIMDELRDQVMAALGQTGDKYEARDGIEMGLVAINTKTREIQFTGANQDLYLFQKGELDIIKGDRMPVGIASEGGNLFSAHSLKLNRGDSLYMFTDGYPDQFGGPDRKKYGSPRLRDLLTNLQSSIMHDQQNTIINEYETWKGDHEQIDDVLMIGIKV